MWKDRISADVAKISCFTFVFFFFGKLTANEKENKDHGTWQQVGRNHMRKARLSAVLVPWNEEKWKYLEEISCLGQKYGKWKNAF